MQINERFNSFVGTGGKRKGANKKKLLSMIMAFAIIFTSVNIPSMMVEAAKTVRVKKVQITKPKKNSITMKKGATLNMKVQVTPKNAKNKRVAYKTSDHKIVTVTSKGKIKAVKNGSAKITVTAKDGSSKKAVLKVKVVTMVNKVKLNAAKKTVHAGKKVTLRTTVTPATASNKKVKWTTSDKKIASVTTGGVVTGKKAGTATITATATDGSGKKATCKVTVKNGLTVWCWNESFNGYAMKEAGKIYRKTHLDFDLEIADVSWDDISSQLEEGSRRGTFNNLPDIILVQDNAFQNSVISYPNAFKDLTRSGIDFSNFSAAKTAYSVIGGKNYGVPFDNGAVIACYRTDYLQQAGFTVDDFTNITWEEYLEKGKTVLEKTGKPLLSCMAGESDIIMMMLQSCGVSLCDKDGKPVVAGNDTLKRTMEIYAALVKAGVLVEADSWEQYIENMNKDKVAGVIDGCWIMASIQQNTKHSGKWAVTNMPKLTGIDGATNYSNNGGSSWAVTSNCQNVRLATDFLACTFAGNPKLYETIINCGALATYLPAGELDVYKKPQVFYGNDAVFAKIVEYAKQTPSINTGLYYYEARDAVAAALKKVIDGANINSELQTAQRTLESIIKK